MWVPTVYISISLKMCRTKRELQHGLRWVPSRYTRFGFSIVLKHYCIFAMGSEWVHVVSVMHNSPGVSLAPEVAWAQERLSEDDASRRSVHSAGALQSQAAIGKSGGVQGRVERADTSLAVEGLSSDRSQPTP